MTHNFDENDEYYRGQVGWGTPPPVSPAVGYASPPVEHQFKKGQSGNRWGRPRKAKLTDASPNLVAAMAEALAVPRTVIKAGKKVKMTIEQIAANKLTGFLLSDDPDIYFKALSFMMKSGMGNAIEAILEREEERRLVEEAKGERWTPELEEAYQKIQAEFRNDRSGYEYAKALMACSCPALAPWREGKAEEMADFEAAHPDELRVGGEGPDIRVSNPDDEPGGPDIRTQE